MISLFITQVSQVNFSPSLRNGRFIKCHFHCFDLFIVRYYLFCQSHSVAVKHLGDDAFDFQLWCRLTTHTWVQLSENRVDDTSPIDVAIVQETIEHILVADKHPAQWWGGIIGCILYWKEKKGKKSIGYTLHVIHGQQLALYGVLEQDLFLYCFNFFGKQFGFKVFWLSFYLCN